MSVVLFVFTVEAPRAVHVSIFELCVSEGVIPDHVRVLTERMVEFVFVGRERAEEVLAFFDITTSFTDRVIVERVEL